MLLREKNIAEGLPFEIDLQRSSRKSAAIYVRNGRAEVRVPNRVPNYWVRQFVLERQDWIEEQLVCEQTREAEAFSLRNGAEISFLGKPVQIRHSNARNSALLVGETLYLPPDDLFTDCRVSFHQWLELQAKDHIIPLCEQTAELVGVSAKLKRVRFKNTKSRWGHCTREGIIQINALIMLAPPEVVHYLVAHEVSHLAHMNHSRSFWALVDTVCEERKSAQNWLRDNEHKLMALH